MKKIVSVLIVVLLIAALCGILVSCGPKHAVTLDYNGGELKGKTGRDISVYEGRTSTCPSISRSRKATTCCNGRIRTATSTASTTRCA